MGDLGLGAMSMEANEINGHIITFYLHPTSNFTSNDNIQDLLEKPYVDRMSNVDPYSPGYAGNGGTVTHGVDDEVVFTTTVEYSYVLGNINGDVDNNLNGIVDLTDAQRILSMISAYQAAHPGEE